MTDSQKTRLNKAVDTLAEKGSRDALVLMDKLALVVSVPNRTVVTVMSDNNVQDKVFTNIDSAVVVAQESPLPQWK